MHQETHLGTRFHCELCDQSYSHSTSLRRHIRRKHKRDQDGGTDVDNTSNMHAGVPDATTEEEGMNQIHSFMVKMEDESEEEEEDEEEM